MDYERKTWNQLRGEQMQNAQTAKVMGVGVDVIEKHQKGMFAFKRREEERKLRSREKRDGELQDKLAKSLARSKRLERRREKQRRAVRASSAPRKRISTKKSREGCKKSLF